MSARPNAIPAELTPASTAEAYEDAEDARIAAAAVAEWEEAGRPKGISLEDVAAKMGIELDDGRH